MPLTAGERTLRAQIAAHDSWARTEDRSSRTANGRKAFEDKFLEEAGGDPKRAEHLRKAYFARLALKSAQARRRRGGVASWLNEKGRHRHRASPFATTPMQTTLMHTGVRADIKRRRPRTAPTWRRWPPSRRWATESRSSALIVGIGWPVRPASPLIVDRVAAPNMVATDEQPASPPASSIVATAGT
jgi:hypothetical protein